MVLEQFLDRRVIAQHFPFVLILSAIYVFVAYAVQSFFFPGQSLATALLLTILLLPSLHHLIVIEEKIESKGSSHFWKRHHTLIKCYLGAFLGILAGFLFLGFIDDGALSYQLAQLEQDHLSPESINAFVNENFVPTGTTVLAVFSHNLMFMLIGFFLSIFYGAGAIFIVAYNASTFAAFIIEIFSRWSANAATLSGIALLHLIPESGGFILSAIAGATLSRAIIHEKLSGDAFRNVIRNCVILLVISVIAIFLAAILETYVTAPTFHKFI